MRVVMKCGARGCLVGLLVGPGGCLEGGLAADLEGPRVFASSLPGPRNVEVSTWPAITVDFSEAIDAASVRVALVAWEEVGRCEFTPRCAVEGASCERGRCMRDPLGAAAVKKLMTEGIAGVGVAVEVSQDGLGPGARVTVRPLRALQARARHSFLLFARDASGAPLVDESGAAAVWRRDLVTADEGSGGPEARLVVPPPEAGEVPPNLARVSTRFAAPVVGDAAATLELEAEDGTRVRLVAPEPCPGWVPGLCLRWRPGSPVLSDMAYRPGGGSLRDAAGRAAVAPAQAEWFVTAAAEDRSAPDLDLATVMQRGPCVYARIEATEPLQLRMTIGARVDEAVAGPGPVVLGLRVTERGAATVVLRAEDLAGNTAERGLPVEVIGWEAPPLGLAEILANPRGPEPGQEFVELVDLRSEGAAQAWSGLFLADRGAAAITGEEGDALPVFSTRPGERVIVVAAGYDPHEGSDPGPAPGTTLVRVDGSLAAGGLKNAGEAVSLYFRPGEAAPVIVASYEDHVATGDAAHAGRSVVADPRSCDLARAWRSEPSGSASPGAP